MNQKRRIFYSWRLFKITRFKTLPGIQATYKLKRRASFIEKRVSEKESEKNKWGTKRNDHFINILTWSKPDTLKINL